MLARPMAALSASSAARLGLTWAAPTTGGHAPSPATRRRRRKGRARAAASASEPSHEARGTASAGASGSGAARMAAAAAAAAAVAAASSASAFFSAQETECSSAACLASAAAASRSSGEAAALRHGGLSKGRKMEFCMPRWSAGVTPSLLPYSSTYCSRRSTAEMTCCGNLTPSFLAARQVTAAAAPRGSSSATGSRESNLKTREPSAQPRIVQADQSTSRAARGSAIGCAAGAGAGAAAAAAAVAGTRCGGRGSSLLPVTSSSLPELPAGGVGARGAGRWSSVHAGGAGARRRGRGAAPEESDPRPAFCPCRLLFLFFLAGEAGGAGRAGAALADAALADAALAGTTLAGGRAIAGLSLAASRWGAANLAVA
jgi:hypothetical protein